MHKLALATFLLTLPLSLACSADWKGGDDGPVMIGTANHDRGRCLPWAMDIQCVVCEEVCRCRKSAEVQKWPKRATTGLQARPCSAACASRVACLAATSPTTFRWNWTSKTVCSAQS